MTIRIYYCKWNKESGPESHDLLRRALEAYLAGEEEEVRQENVLESGPEDAPAGGLQDVQAGGQRDVRTAEGLAGWTVCSDTEHGKPYVKELPEVHFSITHDGGYWVCAVGGCEAGLDLQEVRNRETDRIAERFFHPSETAYLAEHDGQDEFFRLWAKKESYVKYTGKGLAEGLDYFSVVDGVPAVQSEIPFAGDCFLVLTTGEEQEVVLEEML